MEFIPLDEEVEVVEDQEATVDEVEAVEDQEATVDEVEAVEDQEATVDEVEAVEDQEATVDEVEAVEDQEATVDEVEAVEDQEVSDEVGEVVEDQEAVGEDEGADLSVPVSAPFVVDDPLPVYLVDAPEEDAGVDAYSISGSPYPGTISSGYLDYFEGIADKLSFSDHYVAFRSSQYEYLMAWGPDLIYDGYQFKGSALSYCRIYTGSGSSRMSVTFGSDTVYLTPGTGLVYSDLDHFASLTEGGTHLEFITLLFAVGFAVVYSVCHDFFDYVMEHIYRKLRH